MQLTWSVEFIVIRFSVCRGGIINSSGHDYVIKWTNFPRYWPFVQWIHRWPVNSPHKGQWRGALMFSLIRVWINDWINNREPGQLRRHRGHDDVTVMLWHFSYNPGGMWCIWFRYHYIKHLVNRFCNFYFRLWFYLIKQEVLSSNVYNELAFNSPGLCLRQPDQIFWSCSCQFE